MAKEKQTSVTLINKFFPPDSAITGESGAELINYLQSNVADLILNVVHTDSGYIGETSGKKVNVSQFKIKPIFKSRNKILRLVSSLVEGYLLLKKAIKIKSDLVIVMTDPPLLNFWAAFLLKKKRIPWVYWSMDLYPDAFSSAGLVKEDMPVTSLINRVIKSYPPELLIALGEKQAQYIHSKNFKVETCILPCGIHELQPSSSIPEWKRNDKITFGYIGNIGEAHSAEFLINFIKALDPKRHQIVLALYGAKAENVLAEVGDSPSIHMVKHVKKEDLAYVDIHLVSLLPQWSHVCVPSKAVSAVCSGGVIVYNGSKSSDTWHMLSDCGWIVPATDDVQQLKFSINKVLENISEGRLAEKKQSVITTQKNLIRTRSEAFSNVGNYIKNKYAQEIL